MDAPDRVRRAPIPPIVRCRGLTKRHRVGVATVEALHGVDLELGATESLAVVGPSGSGKSTLLNLIGGLDRPSAGSVVVDGRDLAQLTSDELARYRRATVGFVFQQFRLLAHLTALENVALPRILGGDDRTSAEREARALLDRVGLAERLAHRPPQLSAGEQQRVAFARALVNGPRLLVADEPTGNLDADAARSFLDLLAELRGDRGLALLIATHDPEIAGRAERVVQLRAGRVVEHAARA